MADFENIQWGQGKYQGYGGGPEAQEYYARLKFRELFGREARPDELASLSGAYDSGDKNIAGLSAGNSAVAQYYQAQENTPDKQYARQQAEWKKNAPNFYGNIDQLFQGKLGRAATQAERDHFGSLLASGQLNDYQLGEFVNALPENVQKQDRAFREGLNTDLQKQDSQYFNEQIMPGIQSSFANQGRDVRSSAFANSLALAAQGQNRQREQFLSNLTANQYAGSQGLAQRDYLNSYGGYTGLQDYSRQRSAQLQDASTGRINELQDYAIQRRTYDEFLNRYGKQDKWMDYTNLALNGINAGANAYKAYGAGGR